jgi:AGZA family xanthine/uracil permease-like MFS transporter
MKRFFQFDKFGTTYRRETIAGTTTFLTMAYIIVVNPAILAAAGIPREASMTATILAAVIGTVIMGLYANRPFAIAPYMGENAFVAVTVVQVMGFPWQTALAAVFLAGALFVVLTVTKLRTHIAEAIPISLKHSFAVGIGILLAFIGLKDTAIIRLGIPDAPLMLGHLADPKVLLSLFGIIAIAVLLALRVRGAILIGIVVTGFLSVICGVSAAPARLASMPPSISPIFLKLDFAGAFSTAGISVVIMIFVMSLVDTIGTLLGLSSRANLLDEHGNLPDIEKPMLADAIATTAAPLLGTTTTGAFIESATGIEEGGRTGFTALVVATLFLLALFFAPVLTSFGPEAYGPACIIVGAFMIASVKKVNFDDYTELVPSFLTIMLMSFTLNPGIGITAGFITWPLLKLFTGRYREVGLIQWLLFLMSSAFYLVHPY